MAACDRRFLASVLKKTLIAFQSSKARFSSRYFASGFTAVPQTSFGICLGLQGMVEYFGGELGVLPHPMHGKPSRVHVLDGRLFDGLPTEFTTGRYHSLYALGDKLPGMLRVTAASEDGIIMAIEHVNRRLAAVQFHPESILSLEDDVGMRLIRNVVGWAAETQAKA